MTHYGCWGRATLGSRPVPMQDGWYMDGHTRTPKLKPLPFRMTPWCVYGKEGGKTDKRCEGCKWRAQ